MRICALDHAAVRLAAGLLLCAFFVLPAAALDRNKALSQYILEHWRAENGLPHSAIHSITQTRDGYIWTGTEAGVARFDGVKFTVFDKQNTPQITENFAYRLVATADGSLWIGTRGGGLVQYREGKFRRYGKADGMPDEHVYAMVSSRDGGLWIGTRNGGICHFKDGRFTTYGADADLDKAYVLCLYEEHDGTVWAGLYDSRIVRIKGRRTDIFPIDCEPRVFCASRNGEVMVGTDRKGLLVFKDGKFETKLSNEEVNGAVRSLYEDLGGDLWLGIQNEGFGFGTLYRRRGNLMEALTAQVGLSNDDVNAIFEDEEGGLWIGTETGGLNHLKDGKFTTFGRREGLSNEDVLSVREGLDQSLWIGTRSGLNRFKDGKISVMTLDGQANVNHITTVLEARDGTLWFGNTSEGLHRVRNGVHTVYLAGAGGSDRDVWATFQSRDGTIWVGDREGLTRIKDEEITRYTTNNGLSGNEIRAILEDRHGAMWVGTQGAGVTSISNGVYRTWGTKQGLSNGSVRCLFEDRDGVIWIGTRDGGLNRLKDGTIAVFGLAQGLPHDMVLSILEDDSGHLWVGTNKDILRLSKQELEDVASGRARRVRPTVFNEMDGIRSSECTGGFMTAASRTADGRLWFTTKKGVTMVDPARLKLNQRPPPVVLEEVLVNREMIDFRKQTAIAPGGRDFEFHYTALALLNPTRVQFKYQLEGLDTQWVDAGTRRTAFFNNLKPGKYRFRVIAGNEDGVWNELGAGFAFELQPHFYETVWFSAACALTIGFSGIGLHRFRVAQVQARKQELEGTVRDRTKELREEIAERKRGEEALRESEKRFRSLASHAPVGIFMADPLGECLLVNERWCQMAEMSGEEAKGQGWTRALHPEDAERVVRQWKRTVRTGQALVSEFRFENRNGRAISLSASAVPLHNQAGEISEFLMTLTDITDLKRAEESLMQQQALLTNVIAHIPCGVFWKDLESVYLGCNQTFARTLGLASAEEVIGKNDHQLPCSKEEADWFLKCDRQVMESNTPMLNVEEPLHLPDGKQSVVLTSKVPLRDQDGKVTGLLGIFTDIGDQKKIQEALRGLPQNIIDAQETERRRVARELHDGVIQLLSTAKFRLQSMPGMMLPKAGDGTPPLATPDTLLEKAIREIRRISRNLRPSELDDLGLVPAVRSICEEFMQRTGIEAVLDCEVPPGRLPSQMDLALYRIVQEALTNIEKHSEAGRVIIRLTATDQQIELSIHDDGKGFDPSQGSIHYGRQTCMGLVDMKERAAFVRGSLNIHSLPGRGTNIALTIPYDRRQNKGDTEPCIPQP